MKRKAYAKLNLLLDIIGQREDGYHDLQMISVPINLFDTVEIKIADKMSLETDKSFLPVDERNSVIKAINVLRKKFGFKENFSIKIVKNIPTRSGMGGGSSNAALTIRMINDILNLQMSEQCMLEIADEVETDCPFTMYGKPAEVFGTGEIIKPLEVNLDFYMILVKPKRGASTPKVFRKLNNNNLENFDFHAVKTALKQGDYEKFVSNLGNSLEKPATEIIPEIERVKQSLLKFGFDTAIMTGAGSTVFGITQDEQLVNDAVVHFFNKFAFVKKTHIIKDVRKNEVVTIPFHKEEKNI